MKKEYVINIRAEIYLKFTQFEKYIFHYYHSNKLAKARLDTQEMTFRDACIVRYHLRADLIYYSMNIL